jgi:putative hydrolase of the HAD superfamily
VTGFNHIDTWVFDLDNTLYPASCRLFDQMHVKMGEFVSRSLGLTFVEAKAYQKKLFYEYGTTLRGLMVEHGQQPGNFLDYVHDIDYTPVQHDAVLGSALDRLPGRKLIFTNGTVKHAENVMQRLGVTDKFDGIFDIVHSDYIPKPTKEPYDKFVGAYAVTAARAAFFEDIARNLEIPHAMGMTTVLVTDENNQDAAQLNLGSTGQHVHHTTSNLAAFLMRV